ncbi:unnamed protein product [Spirodela intermedia]|uniref:Uncharacterized protein n=1 Tax=Spirodela intermedia TaxID=51605 RepID=A0A7I8IRE1_SPIIN|nr:unnamed protein product [Spirodela intermedia]CAA6660117.1 unnamed protein product [Spirodela intermedia]
MLYYSLKVGIGLLGCGAFFAFLGIVLFFDKGLLALSNFFFFSDFFFSGMVLLLGWQSACQLFMNKKNYKGSICFILGIFSILLRWPIVGFILEIYGTYVLFREFLPSAKEFINHMPGVGSLLHYQFQVLIIPISYVFIMIRKKRC